MYFNLKLCQPAQLTPAVPPTPTRRGAVPEKGTLESEASASSLAQLVNRALDSESMHKTHLFCHTANTEAVDLVPDTAAGAGNQMPAAAPSARGQTNSLCLSFPVWPQGVQNLSPAPRPRPRHDECCNNGPGCAGILPRPSFMVAAIRYCKPYLPVRLEGGEPKVLRGP